MKVKTLEIAGLQSALEALRLPLKGKTKSDSDFIHRRAHINTRANDNWLPITSYSVCSNIQLGDKDLNLLQRLILNGDEHAKVIRGIMAWCSITAPRYWWQEMDTYRIGTDRLCSESTMHRITKDDFGLDDFEIEDTRFNQFDNLYFMTQKINEFKSVAGDISLKGNDKLRILKQMLPESYLQERIQVFSYQTLRRIYFQRRNHRLKEWTEHFIPWIESLPLASELITIEKDKDTVI